jgi:hypothetical protein
MYYYVNGKKVRSNENYASKNLSEVADDDSNDDKKFPVWIFIVLGSFAFIIAIWLIYYIINYKKKL